MKNLMALVLALAIVAFAPGLGMAQDIGLQVTKIPVGLEIHTKSSSGERRVMTFLGKKRKFYEFSVAVSGRRGGNFTARQKFDAQGRYVQWIGGGDYKEKLRPYDCGYKLGD